MLSSTARTFPPADEAHGASKRPAWTVVGVRYEAVAKRLGWVLEELGVPPDVLAPLRSYPDKGDSLLD